MGPSPPTPYCFGGNCSFEHAASKTAIARTPAILQARLILLLDRIMVTPTTPNSRKIVDLKTLTIPYLLVFLEVGSEE
jgi:hypothetical protein